MPNNKWSDEDIESLLRDFPTIKDKRPKAEVHRQLKHSYPLEKQRRRWFPLLVAIVAFLSISVVVVSLLQQNGMSSSGQPANDQAEQSIMTTEDSGPEDRQTGGSAPSEADELRTAVYEEDVQGTQLFRIGLARQAYVVPVSFLVAEEQSGDSLALYAQFAEQIDETQLGFDEYHPYQGYFEQDDAKIKHLLPDDHTYDQGSASELLYLASLEETFRDQDEIRVLDEQGDMAEFSHLGTVEPINPGEQGQSFYLLAAATEDLYLAPAYGLSEADAHSALLALQQAPNDDYRSPVPGQLSYTIEENGDVLTVVFDQPLDLLTLDEVAAMQMIESMALTAKSYGVSLQFSNIVQKEWGGFDFTEKLELPIAPNRIDWMEK